MTLTGGVVPAQEFHDDKKVAQACDDHDAQSGDYGTAIAGTHLVAGSQGAQKSREECEARNHEEVERKEVLRLAECRVPGRGACGDHYFSVCAFDTALRRALVIR